MARNKQLLLWSSLLTLALLVVAAVEENVLREWRVIQGAAHGESGPIDVRLRQVVVPALRVADRCVSCHVAMGTGEQGLTGHPALKSHPDVGHDPANFGCTVCHAGQGRATDADDAHGIVKHWPQPMIPMRYVQAACGSCHTHLAVPNLATLRQGRAAFERYDCLACHAFEGRGGTFRPEWAPAAPAPDLTRIGATAIKATWYQTHLANRAKAEGGPWQASFGEIPEADREAIGVLLASSVGAPRLVEGKALFHTLGCRGCHKVAGVGGDDGPDLTHAGERDPGLTDFTHVPGDPTVANWIAEHFRAPAKLVPGSAMPELGLAEPEIDLLTQYVLSLRRSKVPEAFWPKDRIRAERFGEREFATDGATLYGSFCSACHGPHGEGMRYPGMTAFPAIANADFLAIASDEFLTATVQHGRPGRRMPAWGEKEGGLRAAEVAAVVGHVRKLGGVPTEPDAQPRRWVAADVEAGAALFARNCAQCHGVKGQGAEGPALANRVLQKAASDTYLVQTVLRGRRGTQMQSYATATPTRPGLTEDEVQQVVAFIRTWEEKK